MTWHLKDRELEEKLLAIDPKFVSRLDKVTKDALEFEGKGFLVAGVEAVEVWYKDEVLFALDFSITELEEVEEYNPNDWNDYPAIEPVEPGIYRLEVKYNAGSPTQCYAAVFTFSTDRRWYIYGKGAPIFTTVSLSGFVRFRPWED